MGSRDLQPEMAEQIEAGVRLSLAENWPVQIQFEQALFERRGSDMIDWARPNGSDTTFAINLRAVTFTGLESVATFIPNQEAMAKESDTAAWDTPLERASPCCYESNHL